MSRSRRAVRWLQPGLEVKRWVLTSGIGLVLALLGAAVWADLQPIYWTLWAIQEALSWITRVMPRGITGPLVLLLGIGLVLWGQSRSFGSIQQALAPEKDRELVDALRASGLPALFQPRPDAYHEVDAIPELGTGKTDLAGLRDLALARSRATA